MKLKKLVVLGQIKNGKVFQVALTEQQAESVADYISFLHGGTIKAWKKNLDGVEISEDKQ